MIKANNNLKYSELRWTKRIVPRVLPIIIKTSISQKFFKASKNFPSLNILIVFATIVGINIKRIVV